MPKFYFDVHGGVDARDDVGRDLADGGVVRAEALKAAIALLAAEAADSQETAFVLSVRDEAGRTPLTIRLVSQIEEG